MAPPPEINSYREFERRPACPRLSHFGLRTIQRGSVLLCRRILLLSMRLGAHAVVVLSSMTCERDVEEERLSLARESTKIPSLKRYAAIRLSAISTDSFRI
jgi:hypothetical protein